MSHLTLVVLQTLVPANPDSSCVQDQKAKLCLENSHRDLNGNWRLYNLWLD